MSKSRLTTGVYVFTAAGLLTAWAYSQTPTPLKNPAIKTSPDPFSAFGGSSQSADPNALPPAPAEAKPGKSSRIMFEANWKNVQVGSKPMHFRQGDRPFVWTVKNTGQNPVEIGNDYDFSIAPGEEDFIVDTRLVLAAIMEKTTTVEVKASRVMTQSELSQAPQPTPVTYPSFGPSAANPVNPTYPPPTDQFAPVDPNGRRKPETPMGGHQL